jgi:YHS domain-containing protein
MEGASQLQMVIDPVCKMEIDEKASQFKSKAEGKDVYFCCPHCKAIFDKQPSKYQLV